MKFWSNDLNRKALNQQRKEEYQHHLVKLSAPVIKDIIMDEDSTNKEHESNYMADNKQSSINQIGNPSTEQSEQEEGGLMFESYAIERQRKEIQQQRKIEYNEILAAEIINNTKQKFVDDDEGSGIPFGGYAEVRKKLDAERKQEMKDMLSQVKVTVSR